MKKVKLNRCHSWIFKMRQVDEEKAQYLVLLEDKINSSKQFEYFQVVFGAVGATHQTEALHVQRLRLLQPLGRDDHVPSLQLCSHLRWAEEDHGVTAEMVNQLHQALLIVHPAG